MSEYNNMNESFVLVMPSYNEEGRIKKTLEAWVKIIKKVPGSEILIIDGDSTDKTGQIVTDFSKKNKFVKLIQKPREGYGKDLIYGYRQALKSKHQWIFQTDADNSFKSSDFFKLWKMRESSPLILGRRLIRNDAPYRLIMATIIQFCITMLFKKVIYDSNIPFRLIKSTYLRNYINIIPQTTIAPNLFLSILGSGAGYNLQFIPVKHYFRNNSQNTRRIIKGALKGITELIAFRSNFPQKLLK